MKALLLVLATVLVLFCVTSVLQAGWTGGFTDSDLRVYYYANSSEGYSYASLWVGAQYRIEDSGSSFYTDWQDPTRYTWYTKVTLDLKGAPGSGCYTDHSSVSRKGFTLDTSAGVNAGTENEDLWNYYFSSFSLTPATITNTQFTWDEYYPEWQPGGYAYGTLEVNGYLTGSNAAEFGREFQQVPEPATLALISAGGLFLLRRRQRQ